MTDAVNCQGVWGAGFAKELKKVLKWSCHAYEQHCKKHKGKDSLLGTCLLILPKKGDNEDHAETIAKSKVVYNDRKWVACLFTSRGYGNKNARTGNPGKDRPDDILKHTRSALEDFRRQLERFGPTDLTEDSWKTDDEKPGTIASVLFNSGKFGVPWIETQQLIRQVFAGFERPWYVLDGVSTPPEKDNKDMTKSPNPPQLAVSDETNDGTVVKGDL